jgi:RNA recognition motif-containing protein
MEHKSLTELLGSDSKTSLFQGVPFNAVKRDIKAPEPEKKLSKEEFPDKVKEEDRIVFVGNVSLGCKKKHIKKLMAPYGEVEKVWRRSVPLERGKLPITAAVALKMVILT